MNISRGNRKLKAYQTGYATIRRTQDERYIIIVHFDGWKKSHAIDFHNCKPDAVGKSYASFESARWAIKRYAPNLIIKRALKATLAKTDTYYNQIAYDETSIKY